MEALYSPRQEESAYDRAYVLTLSWGVFVPLMEDAAAYYARLSEHAQRRGYPTLAKFIHAATGRHEKWKQPVKGPTLGELRKTRAFLGISWEALLDGADEHGGQQAPPPNGSGLSVRDAIDRIEAEIDQRKVAVNTLMGVIGRPPRYPEAR